MNTTLPPKAVITGAAMYTVAGDRLAAQYVAFEDRLTRGRPDADLAPPVPGGTEAPAISCRIEALDAPPATTARFSELLRTALDGLPGEHAVPPGPEDRVHLLLPPPETPRGRRLDVTALCAALENDEGRTPEITVHRSGDDGLARLAQAVDELADGRWRRVIVAGVDSLIDTATVYGLARAGRLRMDGAERGEIPGEGAALAVLETPAEGAAGPFLRSLVNVPGGGLGEAISAALREAGLGADGIGRVYADIGEDYERVLAWHRVHKRFWRPRLPENVRRAVELGAIEQPDPEQAAPRLLQPRQAFGCLGAAALPARLALALGHHRYARHMQGFGFPAPQPILLCEWDGAGRGGAACLT